jgi:hypothetical protein
VRATLPGGIEEVLFALLEKAPGARPADAGEVLARLAPFVSAGARSSRSASPRPRPSSPKTPAASAARPDGDTLVSTPAPPVARRADTVDLVERATQPRQISTLVALALILMLSVLAGLTAYVLRLRLGNGAEASDEPVPAKAVSAPRP